LADSEEQIMKLLNEMIASNVKKGWSEIQKIFKIKKLADYGINSKKLS